MPTTAPGELDVIAKELTAAGVHPRDHNRALQVLNVGPAAPTTSPGGPPGPVEYADGPPAGAHDTAALAVLQERIRGLVAAVVDAVAQGGTPADAARVFCSHMPTLLPKLGRDACAQLLDELPKMIDAGRRARARRVGPLAFSDDAGGSELGPGDASGYAALFAAEADGTYAAGLNDQFAMSVPGFARATGLRWRGGPTPAWVPGAEPPDDDDDVTAADAAAFSAALDALDDADAGGAHDTAALATLQELILAARAEGDAETAGWLASIADDPAEVARVTAATK